MKKQIICMLVLIASLCTGGAALASNIDDATYYGRIRATNNSTEIIELVAANVSINTSNWISTAILNSTATNAAMRYGGADTAFMPGYGTNPWIVWFNSIPGNSNVESTLYTGNVTGGKYAIFLDPDMYISDNTSMEISDNGSVSASLYIGTYNSTSRNIFQKAGAYGVWRSDIDEVKSGIVDWYTSYNTTFAATGTYQESANFSSDISSIRARFYNSGGSTYFVSFKEIQVWNGSSWSIPSSASGTGWTNPEYAKDNNTTTGAYYDIPAGSYSEYLTLPLSSTINYTDNATKFRYCVVVEDAPINIMQVDIYTVESGYSLPNVNLTNGEYEISLSFDTANMSLFIDDILEETLSLSGHSIPDNSNNIVIGSASTPYILSANITVSGNCTGSWVWEYGDNFTDLSGYGNKAIPNFRTSSTSDNISASLISFSPVQESKASVDITQDWPSIMEDPPDMPSTTYTEEERPGIFFEPLVHALAQATDLPDSLFWYPFAFTVILGASILIFWLFAEKKTNALFIKAGVATGLMIFFSLPGLNIFGFFVPLYNMFFSFGIIIISRDYGW